MKHTLQQEATRFCTGLRSRVEEVKMKTAVELKSFLTTDLRESNSEDTKAFYDKLDQEIRDMIHNGDAVDKRGGILGIVCLLEVDAGRNLSRYTNYLSNILPCADVQLMEACARTMAHLGLQSGMTEYISRALKRALNEWLRDDKTEYARHCATYVLREFALQTPTMFYQMVTNFFECIPFGLRDSKLVVRESSALTVRAAFYVTSERETYRSAHKLKIPPVYLDCLAEVLRSSDDTNVSGKRRQAGGRQSDEWWHGNILLLNEMVVCCNPDHEKLRAEMELGMVTGNFDFTSALSHSSMPFPQTALYPPGHPGAVVTSQRVPVGDSYACKRVIKEKYDLVWNVVLGYKNSRSSFMVQTMLQIIPRLAALNPAVFRMNYFDKSMEFILQCLRKDREKPLVFQAIGLIALCVGEHFESHVRVIMPFVRNNLPSKEVTNKKRNMTLEASVFMCISLLARALGRSLHEYFKEMLDGMLAGGLNPALTSALRHLAVEIPQLKRDIQDGLLKMLCLVLMGRSQLRSSGMRTSSSRDVGLATVPGASLSSGPNAGEAHDNYGVTLALKTLGSFDFEGHSLTHFLRHSAEHFLSSECKEVRLEAVRTCSYLLNPLLKSIGRTTGSKTALTTVSDVLNKIIVVGITDPDPEVRLRVLHSLDERFDPHLAQAEHLQTLFSAVNDEVFANRESAMKVVGRLCAVNPACVQPSLRKCLLQLIRELEHSGASRNKEHAARLLTAMVFSAPKFIQAYAEPLIRTLLPKLSHEPVVETTSVLVAVTACVGELAQVAGPALQQHVPALFPLILNMMQDTSNMKKREVAVSTFGHLVSNTGFLTEPYKTRPDLLNILLGMLKSEQARSIRREVIRLLGLLGALDPFKYKIFTGEVDAVGDTGMAISLYESKEKKEVDMSQSELLVNVQWNQLDEFFSACTMSAMMRMLRDPSLVSHTSGIIQCIIFIFKALGPRSVTYLGQVMPDYLGVMRTADQLMRQFLYHQLGSIMAIVRVNIKPFMGEIVPIVLESWQPEASRELQIAIIVLMEHMVLALGPDIKPYLASFLPYFLRILNYESVENHRVTDKLLKSLEYFGPLLNEYYHILIPAIVRILDTDDVKIDMRSSVLQTLEELCIQVDLSDLACRIVQPALRCMERYPELQNQVMNLLTTMLMRMGSRFMVFLPNITKAKTRLRVTHSAFDMALYRVMKGAQWLGARINPPSDDLSQLKTATGSVREKQQIVMEADNAMVKLQRVSTFNLEKAWHCRGIVSKPDWTIWLRNIATTQLKESSNPALRACCSLATGYAPLAAELFNAAYVSVWYEFNDQQQDLIINIIENVMKSVDDMPEISQTLLNLAEFMEHCDRGPLPLQIGVLADRAIKIRAFAKALHYKEQEFLKEPTPEILESLISINNKLQQHEAAQGVLDYATKYFTLRNEEMYLEKLHDWSRALKIYNKKLEEERLKDDQNLILGRMRCWEGLGEWGHVNHTAAEKWSNCTDELRQKMAHMAAYSAWALSSWDDMRRYVEIIPKESCDGSFLRAVLAIHEDDFILAQQYVEKARDILDTGLTAMAGESYSRAYGAMVYAQMFSELEEVMQYKLVAEKREILRNVWRARLKGCQNLVEDWCRFLHIRSLVMNPQEDSKTWLKLASLCQKTDRENLSMYVITQLLGYNPDQLPSVDLRPEILNFEILFSYTKHLWHFGRKEDARERLKYLAESMFRTDQSFGAGHSQLSIDPERVQEHKTLLSKVFLKLGELHENMSSIEDEEGVLKCRKYALTCYRSATEMDPNLKRAWQSWALANYSSIDYYRQQLQALRKQESLHPSPLTLNGALQASPDSANGATAAGPSLIKDDSDSWNEANEEIIEMEKKRTELTRLIESHCVPAVRGFVSSVILTEKGSLQDILRLINLLFNYGYHKETREALRDGLNRIQLDNWLLVIQQLLARIDTAREHVSSLIVDLLINVGKEHPQALINPLILAFKSGGSDRRRYNANKILYSMEEHSPRIVTEGFLLNEELIRLAITWLEMWHECLEDASRVFFGEHDIKAMFALLQPLHELTDKGPETLKETAFHQEYIRELNEARECGQRYQHSEASKDIHQAWEIYYGLYRKLARQVPNLAMLELSYASPRLVAYGKSWELAVPGTYEPNKDIVKIKGIKETLHCISSKQRPRKLTVYGTNGQNYMFLLKGHEDIRQDERVMQFFGLANTLLMNDAETFRRNLTIQRMSVIPLSTNTGLIGWVPNSDTLHSLIRDYRDCKKVMLNIEHRIMLRMAPDFERLTVIQKTEVLEHGLAQTIGDDLAKVLWIKSPNSEIWFDRRTNYIRSLATMSVVGYILGLGDRHPSNIMLDRETGKIIHIDFGDCFEVATMRDKFPEKVPFRLTRMLIKAMEVTGIDGTFRKTCEMVMDLMRANKESLLAVLEAFVYDPLLQWILLDNKREFGENRKTMKALRRQLNKLEGQQASLSLRNPAAVNPWTHHLVNGPWFGCYDESKRQRRRTETGSIVVERNGLNGFIFSAKQPVNEDNGRELEESTNNKAVNVMQRVQAKLKGEDFNGMGVPEASVDTKKQVDLLIREATSNQNLCQMYIGWCPFW